MERTPLKQRAKSWGTAALRERGRRDFLRSLPHGARVFDIGCGNDSPYLFKAIRPDLYYVGLDIMDYNQSHDPTEHADEYVAVDVADFVQAIEARPDEFDAVTSAHNLEHCEDPDATLVAMARSLASGGRMYLGFPSAATLDLPSRGGTLNFFDDDTHVRPPDFQRVLEILTAEGMTIDFAAERYRHPVRWLFGAVTEPISRARNQVMSGTWSLYGFETIIWATKA